MSGAHGVGTAVLGGGFMATVHSRAARAAGARLVGGLSATPDGTARAVAELGLGTAYRTLDELVDDPRVDVVHVCTPNALHHEQALRVLESGKAVVCEKPLATTVDDAHELAVTARARGAVATVPFVYRFHPLVREARARVAAGGLGDLVTVDASYLQDWLVGALSDNWRVGTETGGASRAFADIGSHLVDLVEFVTADRVQRLASVKRTVHATRAEHRAVRTEDAVAVTAVLDSGALATLLVSQVAPGRKNSLRFEIGGTEASMAFDQESPDQLWVGRRRSSELVSREAEFLAPDAARLSVVPAGHPQGYQDAFNAFVADTYAALSRGIAPDGLPTFDDGLRAAAVTDAVLRSAQDEKWVDVDTVAATASTQEESAWATR